MFDFIKRPAMCIRGVDGIKVLICIDKYPFLGGRCKKKDIVWCEFYFDNKLLFLLRFTPASKRIYYEVVNLQ